ncbi:MAG: hypothetical protein AB9866_20645 [Syntrophobacteraceae bacterium]
MKPNGIANTDRPEPSSRVTPSQQSNEGQSFDKLLKAASLEDSGPALSATVGSPPKSEISPEAAALVSRPANSVPVNGAKGAAAYKEAMTKAPAPTAPAAISDFQKYKDDQLLRNPGGRNYYLDEKKVVENSPDQASFISRLGKDISSVFGNIRNMVGNIFLGSKFLYRGENSEILESRQKGLIGTIANFFKDLGSALSFGMFHPDRSEAPKGFLDRLSYSANKLKDAFMGDLLEGIPSSINHMGKNLVLAGWHLTQVLPDATIGNFDAGRKLTTSIFDNGHVMVEYLTDVLPSGDAWLRVHASNILELQLPVLYNLKMSENFSGDNRWQFVRNTPFRKKIETLGALLADAAALGLIGQTSFSSNRHHRTE